MDSRGHLHCRQRKPGSQEIYITFRGPRDLCLPALETQPQTLALVQALQAPKPREKPASQHDSLIPSGCTAFIWPSPVGRDLINSLHAFAKLSMGKQFLLSPRKMLMPRECFYLVIILSPLDIVPVNQGRDLSEHLRDWTEKFLGEWEVFV